MADGQIQVNGLAGVAFAPRAFVLLELAVAQFVNHYETSRIRNVRDNDVGEPDYLAAEPVKGSPIAFSDKTIAKALANIYRKRVNVKTEIEPELFLETVRLFNLASATGISDAVEAGTAMPDDDFLQAIKTNNEVFSAFRTHKMQNDIAKLMTDGDGKLKSFSKFAKDVKPYTEHNNRAWLQTEYNTAVLRAHQAADWQQFEREKDVLPNLEWMPSTSTHPGEDHQPFWRTILPIDHPFWNEHRPGDRWNCKCRLRNTDEPPTTAPTGTKNDQPNRGLENNPGKDGKLFSDKHPYMPQSCGTCPFGHGKLWALAAGKGKNCAECGSLEKATHANEERKRIEANRKEYERLKADANYKDVEFNEQTGALKATHIGHNFDPNKGMYEIEVQNIGYKKGNAVVFETEKGKAINENYTDGRWNNMSFDIGCSLGTGKNNIKGILNHCKHKRAEIAIIYFPNKELYSYERLINGIRAYNGQTKYRFKEIIYIVDDEINFYK